MSDVRTSNEQVYTTDMLLHVLRNPHGWGSDVVRKARLGAADEIERLEALLAEPNYCAQCGANENETSDDVLCRIHSELARGHSSAALAVVAAAREHRPLPACASCDVVTLSQNAQKASEGRQHIVKQNGAHAVGCPGCQPDYALSEGDQRG